MRQKFYIQPFANAGDLTVIPDPTQVSGSVSMQSGWPFDYQRVLGTDSAALPIDRATTNWLFNTITTQLQQYQEFGFPEWIDSADNGGTPFAYDFGAVVRYSASGNPPFTTYISALAGAGTNTSTPGADANWRVWSPDALYQPAGNFNSLLNGSTSTFTLPQVPIGSVAMFKNGVYNSASCTFSGANVTWTGPALQTGDTFEWLEYRY